jgi:hypothetical protein
MVMVLKRAYDVRREANRDLSIATAEAQVALADEKGTVAEKAAQIVLKVQEQSDAAAVADAAFWYADSVAREVERRTSAVQTISRMVGITYALAGTTRSEA